MSGSEGQASCEGVSRGAASKLEDDLLRQIREGCMPEPGRELQFAIRECGRRWRFDLAYPEHLLAIEIEGGSFSQGRHLRGKPFEADCIKYAVAQMLGWKVLRVNNHMVEDGRALTLIAMALYPHRYPNAVQVAAAMKCGKCMTAAQKRKRKKKAGEG